MSRLYASVESDSRKTAATSRGHQRIDAHVRGWDVGVKVVGRVVDGVDVFEVFRTSGSNGSASDQLIAVVAQEA